jgi:hypothetical protein
MAPSTWPAASRTPSARWPPPSPPPWTALLEVVGGWRPGDVRHVFASPALAADRLGFRARVGFGRGMAEFAGAALRQPVSAG